MRSDDDGSSSSSAWADLPEHSDSVDGAVDVPVQAGDLILGDARVLHGARKNQTEQRRSLVTLWYMPGCRTGIVGERMQRNMAKLHLHQCGELYDAETKPAETCAAADAAGWSAATVAHLRDKALLPDLFEYGQATQDADGNTSESDKYDHNLGFMDRQPGFTSAASKAAKLAYKLKRSGGFCAAPSV